MDKQDVINNITISMTNGIWTATAPGGAIVFSCASEEVVRDVAKGNVSYIGRLTLKDNSNESLAVIEEELRKQNIFYDIDSFDATGINVHVRWGDWKHNHGYLDYFMTTRFNLKLVGVTVTEENGSDCYSATHNYVIITKEEKK